MIKQRIDKKSTYLITVLFFNLHKGFYLLICSSSIVNLGYNDHGFNEFSAITKKYSCNFWWSNDPFLTYFHGYNE